VIELSETAAPEDINLAGQGGRLGIVLNIGQRAAVDEPMAVDDVDLTSRRVRRIQAPEEGRL
jgi:hypothetical protein